MNKVFITGASGFIGQKLVAALMEQKYKIHVLLQEGTTVDCDIIPYIGNITNKHDMSVILKNADPDYIIHLAARTEVEKSFYDPIDYQLVNYNGTVNLIEIAKELKNLKLFIFSSTMETYGAVPKSLWSPFNEETPQYPNAPYAVAKIASEYYFKYASRAYNLPYTILRQTNTYGREDNDFFVVEQIISQMLKNPNEINLGYPEPVRNFLFIDDLIQLYLTILHKPKMAVNEVFCTGPDNGLCIEDLVFMIARKLNWQGKINWYTKPERVGEIYYLNSSSDKAKTMLSWQPSTDLDTGLDKTIQIWKKKLLSAIPT